MLGNNGEEYMAKRGRTMTMPVGDDLDFSAMSCVILGCLEQPVLEESSVLLSCSSSFFELFSDIKRLPALHVDVRC